MIDQYTFIDTAFWNNILSIHHLPDYFIRHFFETIEWGKRKDLIYHALVHLWYIQDTDDGDKVFIATIDERDPRDVIDIDDPKELESRFLIHRFGKSFKVHSSNEIIPEVFKYLSEIDYNFT